MAAIRLRSVEDIAETLQNARSRRRGCALLIGAGCSARAGIPTAAGFVEIIKKEFPNAYDRAATKTYPSCMAELTLIQRRDLIAQYVDEAKVNWAHLCIASLMEARFVDRILTTNFDLLLARACALMNAFPAIYDFATSQLLKRADIPDAAVFYLHGQRTGFVLMNTVQDMARHSTLLGPVFDDAGNGRVWIVVGYSGENDPVFNHLANVPRFDNGLFWIGYGDEEPAPHVRENLLEQDKDAFFTRGHDADSFFVALTRELGIFPPDLVVRPFTRLQGALERITPFVNPDQPAEDDVLSTPRQWIQSAIEEFEKPAWDVIMRDPHAKVAEGPAVLTVAARYLLMQGRYQQVLEFRDDYDSAPSDEFADVLSMAYVMRGNQLLDDAKVTTTRAKEFFNQARAMYAEALAIKPDRHEALHNWGNLLLDMAKTKTAEEAKPLFDEAEKKYADAHQLAPEGYEILINWGNLLLDRAKATIGEEAERFFDAAEAKYSAVLAIKPGLPNVLQNWGNLLLDRAKTLNGKEADRFFAAAEEKYDAALELKPDLYEALYQWGNLLLDRAKASREEKKADELFALAEKKYQAALAIKPDMYRVFSNWGNLLLDQAKTRSGAAADELFARGVERFEAALAIEPGLAETLNNWGNLLSEWHKTKTGPRAEELFVAAQEKYEAAVEKAPEMHEALVNWANLLVDYAKTKTGREADELFERAEEKYRSAHAIKRDRSDVLHNWGNALAERARRTRGADAEAFYADAEAKYQAAHDLRPWVPDVLRAWWTLLRDWAKTKTGKEAARLIARADDKERSASAIEARSAASSRRRSRSTSSGAIPRRARSCASRTSPGAPS
jgi:Tfp pilus assembly protein PilF